MTQPADIPPTDPGVSAHTIPRQMPGGRLPGRRARGHRSEHATLDLKGAREGQQPDVAPAQTHDGTAVYSTGGGQVDAYHYHRDGPQGQAYEQLYATREDMQIEQPQRAPELKGPGQ